jgi:glycosyltransferase involved in cell wall biosynthesis
MQLLTPDSDSSMARPRSVHVSIVTPTYNHEKFIGPCIESAIRQSYGNWEQIILDDGSTDATAKVIRGYADPRIRYFHQENQGIEALAHSYNRVLGMCKGELIAILEGDDVWPREKLATLVPGFADQDVVLAYGAVADLATDGTWRGRVSRSVRKRMRLPRETLLNHPRGSATRYMLRADGVDLVPPSAVLIRRTALASIGGFQYVPGLCVTDFPTFVTLSLAGKFYYTPQVMGYRRRHLGSATYNNLTRIVTAAHDYADRFLNQHSDLVTSAEREAIEQSWDRSKASLEFTAGRVDLATQQWKRARSHFQGALDPLNPGTFLAAALGWASSWLHRDLETVMRLLDGADLRERRTSNS